MTWLTGLIATALGALLGALGTYVTTRSLEQKKRAEQYQLEQIENILRVIVLNVETCSADPADPARQHILQQTKVCLTLLEIYGDDEVLKILSDIENPNRNTDLVKALQVQGRRLAYSRK